MAEAELSESLTGLAIREFLTKVGEAGPNDFFKVYRKVKKSASYNNCRRYFWILKRLGLIEPTRREMGKGYIPRQLYRICAGSESDTRWGAPQAALYPETRLGARRYSKEKGRV
jgi:hypothetical protein